MSTYVVGTCDNNMASPFRKLQIRENNFPRCTLWCGIILERRNFGYFRINRIESKGENERPTGRGEKGERGQMQKRHARIYARYK